MKINEAIVQDKELHDDSLHMKAGSVNMRLFRNNEDYRKLILGIVDHMRYIANINFEDYSIIRGISGANIGIPLNIIAIKRKSGIKIFLNPVILFTSKKMFTTRSNCGSLNLSKSISAKRYETIRMRYYDIYGEEHEETFVNDGTIQHEIEHNLGILITDK